LQKGVVVLYVFVEIAGEYNVMVSILLLFDEFDEILAKIVARFSIVAFLGYEGGLLLVVSSGTSAARWFFTHLVSSDEHGCFAVCAFRMQVGPATIFVTIARAGRYDQ
jgi:hypothetical protein